MTGSALRARSEIKTVTLRSVTPPNVTRKLQVIISCPDRPSLLVPWHGLVQSSKFMYNRPTGSISELRYKSFYRCTYKQLKYTYKVQVNHFQPLHHDFKCHFQVQSRCSSIMCSASKPSSSSSQSGHGLFPLPCALNILLKFCSPLTCLGPRSITLSHSFDHPTSFPTSTISCDFSAHLSSIFTVKNERSLF